MKNNGNKKLFFIFQLQRNELYTLLPEISLNPGGFQAWWLEVYALAQPFQTNLGNTPNQVAVDPDVEAQICQNGSYDPF